MTNPLVRFTLSLASEGIRVVLSRFFAENLRQVIEQRTFATRDVNKTMLGVENRPLLTLARQLKPIRKQSRSFDRAFSFGPKLSFSLFDSVRFFFFRGERGKIRGTVNKSRRYRVYRLGFNFSIACDIFLKIETRIVIFIVSVMIVN